MKINRILAAAAAICITAGTTVPAAYVPKPVFTAQASASIWDTYDIVEDGSLVFYVYDDHVLLAECKKEAEGHIDIPAEINGLPVTEIQFGAFSDCVDLTSVKIPASITCIEGGAFRESGVEEIDIPEGIRGITVESFDETPWLEKMRAKNPMVIVGDMVVDGRACKGDVVIPDGITYICDMAFDGATEMTSVSIPESVTEIGPAAFGLCTRLTEFTFPSGITELSSFVLDNCENLVSVTLPEGITKIGNGAFHDCTSLASVNIPASVETIEEAAFESCKSLTEMTIPATVKCIGHSAFEYCYGLTSFTLTRVPEEIGLGILMGCSSLTEVSLPEDMKSLPGFTFCQCSSLRTVALPEGMTEIGEYAFSQCSSLTDITIPAGVTRIEKQTFSECLDLTSITIPDGVEYLGDEAFAGSLALGDITIPESVKDIGTSVFYKTKWLYDRQKEDKYVIVNDILIDGRLCSGHIILPDTLKRIAGRAFDGCDGLFTIMIPAGVEAIGDEAFRNCTKLRSIEIPNEAKAGGHIFIGCENLTDIYYGGAPSEFRYYIDTLPLGYLEYEPNVHYNAAVSHLPKITYGDANTDGKITVSDAVSVLQNIANAEKYPLSGDGSDNADCDGVPGITGGDALMIQKFDAGVIDKFPAEI